MPLVVLTLFLLVLLESTIVSIPLSLIFLICLLVIKKERWVLALGLVTGLILDILLIRNLGITGMVIVSVLFLIMLYQRKFEIATYYFTAIASFFAALFYLTIFSISHMFLHAVISAVLAILFFAILRRVFAKAEKPLGTA